MSSRPDDTLTAEIARLDGLGLGALRDLWRERLGSPPRFASTELTRLWLAWELQARARGGYDPATRRWLKQLSKSSKADAPPTSAARGALKPGAVLTREWGGVTHRVMVLEEGFAWAGQTYGSLSEIATRISGTRWSGPRFFGLKQGDR
ncbi:DUF2924 domain-containing protein [Reyranella soli]|uniref:DUF2924 domain-containing protein n=1 Tax=Reyranella soli TaxID=1230389 RepID=A0A512NKH9_9HYPH|nr:DUF2924 domain-containing protein [Reyranella soli]GEP59457.1 hypothetical protein RSO01_66230 [Reyranella soli]